MELERLTLTQLTDRNIIHPRKINFLNDMNGKMVGDNADHHLDAILAYLGIAGSNYGSYYGGFESAIIAKESERIITDEEMAVINTTLHQYAKEVDFRSGLGSAVGHLIFPGERAYINGITKTNIVSRLTTIAAGFTANAVLYPGAAAAVTNLKITYTTDRTNYLSKLGIKDSEKVILENLETVYNEAFSDAVCDLSKMYRRNPGKAASYWNQSLLLPTEHHTHDHHTGDLAIGDFIMIKTREFFEKTQIMIESLTEHATISATILAHVGDPVVADMSVTGIASSTKKAWKIGGEAGRILMLKNDSPGVVNYNLDIID